MLIQVSIGEVIDKYSILEIKSKHITDSIKLQNIHNEISCLQECKQYIQQNQFLYNLLIYVNQQIWDLTNQIKSLSINDSSFSSISNLIFDFNQKRFRIKNMFNHLFESHIKEEKSYLSHCCKLITDNEETIYSKIPEINYLLIEYDTLIVQDKYYSLYKQLFQHSTIIQENNISIHDFTSIQTIQLQQYSISPDLIPIFDFQPIRYASSGKLGDFIQTLSIINEKFYQTGRKGILYIRELREPFSSGLNKTFQDTYTVIQSQKYIQDYHIYNQEHIDIELDSWRSRNDILFTMNWYHIFKQVYNVEWGLHPWIHVPHNTEWENKILINQMEYRQSYNIDYQLLYEKYKDSLVFISFNKKEYDDFIQKTNLNIPHYQPSSFMDACIAIHSCKLLVATLSGILTIGHACHKNRIIGLCGSVGDDIHNNNFNEIWNHVSYSV